MKSLSPKNMGLICFLSLMVFQSQAQSEYLITSQENELVASIKVEEAQTVLNFSGDQLFGVSKRVDKRKYYNNDNVVVYAVKYSESSFKLRDAQEQLQWKVKVYQDYLKVSENEEMTNAYRIAFSDSGKLKVKQEGEEQYAIRLDQKAPRFKAGDYFVMNFKSSLATGLLLIEEIPLRERVILASEVIRAGK